jgi:hypothetical protein
VKSKLTTGELANALDAGRRFQQLRVEELAGSMMRGGENVDERFRDCPPFFVFAYECDVSPQTLVDRLDAAGREDGRSPVDAVFLLGRGIAIDYGDGRDRVKLRLDDGTDLTGWGLTANTQTLSQFVGWLSMTMPRTVRWLPISLRYLSSAATHGVVVPTRP